MKIARWKVNRVNEDAAQHLGAELGIPRLAARLLAARGVEDIASAKKMLTKDIALLNDPFLLPDMEKAVSRVNLAIENREKVTVYGDYDVDGITATYILSDYLKSRGVDCDFYIPDRIDEGYGVNLDAVDKLIENGTSLIITVDTGITAHEAVEYAREQGCEIVITDHHECRETLPEASAVVNPTRPDSEYPMSEIAGVCVAFKLICALEGEVAEKYLPFVCIGTIADVMPLIGENRAIVAKGLEMLNSADHTALCALLEAAGIADKEITTESVGFALAPRMNAAGRMKNASFVVELLYETSRESALHKARELCDLNRDRQAEEKSIFDEALELLPSVFNEKEDNCIVLAGDGWHHGVIGIVASKLSAKFNRPTILLTKDGEVAKGSGRGINGVNLYEALSGASHLLTQYGGHEMAVGLTLPCENVDALREYMNSAITLSEADIEICADFEVLPSELTVPEIEGLAALEPFGTANPQPLLVMSGLRAQKITPIGKGRHLRFALAGENVILEAVYFGKTIKDIGFTEGDTVDVMFNPKVNDFKGKSAQLMVCDIRICREEIDCIRKADELYSLVLSGSAFVSEYEKCNISYNELGTIWRAIASLAKDGAFPLIRLRQLTRISYEKLFVALDVFNELQLLEYSVSELVLSVKILPHQGKADLESSKILQNIAMKAIDL